MFFLQLWISTSCAINTNLVLSYQVDINHAGEIDEIFDAISYRKGASVIRMLQSYLGPESFQVFLPIIYYINILFYCLHSNPFLLYLSPLILLCYYWHILVTCYLVRWKKIYSYFSKHLLSEVGDGKWGGGIRRRTIPFSATTLFNISSFLTSDSL